MIDKDYSVEEIIHGLEELENEAYDRWVHCQYTQDKLINGIGKYITPAIKLLQAINNNK